MLGHPPPVAVRLSELRARQLRREPRAAGGRHLGDLGLVGGAPFAHDAREVRLPAPDALLAVRAADDEPRQLELRLHRARVRGGLLPMTRRYHSDSSSSGIFITRPNCSSGAIVSGMLLPSDELIFF